MDTFLWIAGAAIVLIACYFYLKKMSIEQAELKAKEHDSRSHVVNDSNYNIAREGVDGHRTEELTTAEAKEAAEDFRTGSEGDTPSREEYRDIKRTLGKK